MRLIAMLSLVTLELGGCESCEFTYGSYTVDARLIVKGQEPADLEVRTCKGPHPDDCLPVYVQKDPMTGIISFTAGVAAEGFWTCGFDHRWLVVTGSGCEETALELLSSSDIHQAAPVAIEEPIDITIACRQPLLGTSVIDPGLDELDLLER